MTRNFVPIVPLVVSFLVVAVCTAPAVAQPVCHVPAASVAEETAPASVFDIRQGVGRISSDNVTMTVNTLPENPTDDRVFVTPFGQGTGRPGLRFEVRESALELASCDSISGLVPP